MFLVVKWARDAFVLWWKPVITTPAHKGIAITKFLESCFVGINECGKRPSKFVEPINKTTDMRFSVQVCPL